jgi:hypothetical protein
MTAAVKKRLVIVPDYVQPQIFGREEFRSADICALTPAAMLACEHAGLPFLTAEDFYGAVRFRNDNEDLIAEGDRLFAEFDRRAEPHVGFPRAFSSSSYWFLIFFADLMYVSRLCDSVKLAYDEVYIAAGGECRKEYEIQPEYNDGGLRLFYMGLENKVRMMSLCLGGKCRWIDSGGPDGRVKAISARRMASLAKKMVARSASCVRKGILRGRLNNSARPIFIMQGSFEVEALKKYMPDTEFIEPLRIFRQSAGDKAPEAVTADLFAGEEVIRVFVRKFFPAFEDHVIRLFGIYITSCVARVNPFRKAFADMIERLKPRALVYSQGANRIMENAAAWIANARSIPVFYFQHGGCTAIFSRDPYQKYHEYNPTIRKTQIIQSSAEKEFYSKPLGADAEVLGSVKLYRLYENHRKKNAGPRGKKVLYCPLVFNFYAFKQLLNNMDERAVFNVSKEIVGAMAASGLPFDIKTHPGFARYHDDYFTRLIAGMPRRGRVLGGFMAEEILDRYGLLILDYIATMLIPTSFIFEMPVIMYAPDRHCFNESPVSDLEKRFYFVKDRNGLEEHLNMYKEGVLESRFSPDFIDRYLFPINGGDPGRRIAEYIDARTGYGATGRQPEKISR